MDRPDPYRVFRFKVEIDAIQVASFSECSGLQAETEFEEVQVGGINDYRPKLPKGTKYGNVVLKRGITDSEDLWQWHRDVVSGVFDRHDVGVVLLGPNPDNTEELWRWTFQQAFPVKWTGPDLKADGNQVAVETLELAHHGCIRADTTGAPAGA